MAPKYIPHESHPFGDLLSEYLSRKHGLSQNQLAADLHYDPSLISRMAHGDRLRGPTARQRVLAIISWLCVQGVLRALDEANALLQAAGMANLRDDAPQEQAMFALLPKRGMKSSQQYAAEQSAFPYGTAPAQPSFLFGRAADMLSVKKRLGVIADASPIRQRIVVIRGWPGVGKSTLAAALAHDTDLAGHFTDHILWGSLGETPDIATFLGNWWRILTKATTSSTPSVEAMTGELTALLRDRRVLFIIDDVWDAAHALPFKIGGRHCGYIYTTRLPIVAQEIAGTADAIYVLPVLSETDALELLRSVAPQVVDQHTEQCRNLVQTLEGLPLALQVAGRMLASESSLGWGIDELLYELHDGVKILEAQAPLDRIDATYGTRPTVAVLLHRSTMRLNSEIRNAFALLGAFPPKPATFDWAALTSIWQVADPKPVVRVLVERGLLEPVPGGRFQLHALLRAHARSLLTD